MTGDGANILEGPKCSQGITRGMLMRLHYDQEPGGGWTRDALFEHYDHCGACKTEMQELSDQDAFLQDRFEREVLANAEMAGKIRRQLAAARSLTAGIAAGVSDEGSGQSESMLYLAAVRAATKAEKATYLVRALDVILAAPDQEARAQKLKWLSEAAKAYLDDKDNGLSYQLDESRNNRVVRYTLDNDEKACLVLSMLATPEWHAAAAERILKMAGPEVEINWPAWMEATVAVSSR